MSTTNTSGRRKTAVARIYLKDGNGGITVNGKDYKEYFPTLPLQFIVTQSTEVSGSAGKFDVTVNVAGGGVKGQAEAVRLAIAKAIVELDPETKPSLRAKRSKNVFTDRISCQVHSGWPTFWHCAAQHPTPHPAQK